jgi:hypothetical protein
VEFAVWIIERISMKILLNILIGTDLHIHEGEFIAKVSRTSLYTPQATPLS